MKRETNKYLKIRNKFKYFVFLCIYILLYPLAKIIYGRKNNWLICERGIDAQDNGFAFYQFLRNNYISINAVYLIKSHSTDFDKVNQIGRTVEFGSFKHFLMAIGCPVKISSQLYGYAPWVNMALFFRRNKTKDVHVFLQHGIIKNAHEGLYSDSCKSLDLFICGAKPEYEFVLKTFGYGNDVPKYTGLARYDKLLKFETKNQILFMPTWRRNLNCVSENDFLNSRFYKEWNKLLESNALIEKCNNNNLVIKFYLHASLQKYSNLFKETDCIKIINFKDEDVQSLLKESLLLVTDFSSVYFDFAYMHKPVVYYQFDEDTFYKEHYAKGYFDYRRDGFGDVCIDSQSAIGAIVNAIDNNFEVEDKYLIRIKNNFMYEDQNNSERIYRAIIELIN